MEANSLDETQSFHAPRLRCVDAGEPEPPFVPLRLMLQPGGLAVELTRPDMILGRHSQADVRVGLPDVSRRHCRFLFEQGQWRLYDLNSLNGTRINGERLAEAALGQGDQICIGSLTFTVDLDTAPFQGEAAAEVIKSIVDVLPPTARKAS